MRTLSLLPNEATIQIVKLRGWEIGQTIQLPLGAVVLDVVAGPALLVMAPNESIESAATEHRIFYIRKVRGPQPEIRFQNMTYVGHCVFIDPDGRYSGCVVWESQPVTQTMPPSITDASSETAN